MMRLSLRIAVVLLIGLLFIPGAAFGLAPGKKGAKPKKQQPRKEQGEQRRSGQGDLGRFTENLPPQLRDAIHQLWDRMPPQIRDRVQERMGQMKPEQRQELVQRFSNRQQQRGGRPDARRQGRPDQAGRPDARRQGRPDQAGRPDARRQGRPDQAGRPDARRQGRPDQAGRPDARRQGRPDQAGPDGSNPMARAMRERLQQLAPEQRERIQKAMEGMSPERRKALMERARGMGQGPDAAGRNRPGPDARAGRDGARNVPGRGDPATTAGRPAQGGVAEERVKNMIKGEISKLPQDVRQRIREALGHLPAERRAQVLSQALAEESDGGRPQNARPGRGNDSARPGKPGNAGEQPRAKKGKEGKKGKKGGKGDQGERARNPNRPAPAGPHDNANRPPRRGGVERMIRSGISALPEPMRKQLEERLGRVLPRLSEGHGNVLQNFREALQRRFQALAPGDQSKIMNWYQGDQPDRTI